jgi:hypothetical protein
MRPRPLLLALALAVTACASEPQAAKEGFAPEDEWASYAPSAVWLVATHGTPNDHKKECARAFEWIDGEEKCAATSCQRGVDLAEVWQKRCPKFDRAHVDRVKEVAEAIQSNTSKPSTPCEDEADALLKGSCAGEVCARATQKWATKCGAKVASPLTVRFLERLVERQTDASERVQLDVRSCDELAGDVKKGVGCKDQFVCADALKKFEFLAARCATDAEPLSVAAGALGTLLAAAAQQKIAPVVVDASKLMTAADAPVVLSDGSGVVVSVCGDRPTSLDDYRAKRRACSNGDVVYARAFKVGAKIEVRLGALAFPDDARFTARFPTLVAMGEVLAKDKEAYAAVGQAIERAGHAGASAGAMASALASLRAAFGAAEASLKRPSAAAALAAHDASLVGLFTQLGRAKRAAAGRGSPDAGGVLVRGRSRALADVDDRGDVKAGAASAAGRVDTRALFPRAMGAYLDALDPTGSAAPRRVDAGSVRKAESAASGFLGACADAEKTLQRAKGALVSCGFGLEACANGRAQQLAAELDAALAQASVAWDGFDTARTGAANAASSSLSSAADSAGCREPWW